MTQSIGAASVALASWVTGPEWCIASALALLSAVLHAIRLSRWAGERTSAEPLVLILHLAYAFVPINFLLVAPLYFATDAASQKVGNIKLNNKVSVAIASQTEDFYKLRGLSMSGIATRLLETKASEEVSLRLFRRLPQSKRFVPQDPKQLAVFSIAPVAISLVDYAAGFGTSYLLEL